MQGFPVPEFLHFYLIGNFDEFILLEIEREIRYLVNRKLNKL